MEDILAKAIDRMLAEGAEFCDAKHQTVRNLTVRVVDGSVKALNEARIGGVCFRARVHGSWGYSTAVSLDKSALLESCAEAARNAHLGAARGPAIPEMPTGSRRMRAQVRTHPDSVPIEEKLELAKDLDASQKVERKVVNSNANYREELRTNLLVNSFGSNLKWEEVRVRLMAFAVASEAGRQEMYYDMLDGTRGFELVKEGDVGAMGRHIGEEAVKMLAAKKPPSGHMTCITDPANSGLLAHEVMGHAAEADEVVKRRSFLTGLVGRKVASEQITMIDDGAVPGAYGSIPVDDEGTPSSRTTIIEEGVYRGYMHSLETAAEMGATPTGNGRAQDFARRVWVRMTNTFFDVGDWSIDEMVEDVDYGVLTEKMISGMEDPVGGGFEAKALRGFLIERGRITDMVRSLTLTGNALEILKTTDAVGNELRLDGGNCGKGIEDFVPVSSGGPYCRHKIVVGGG